MASSFYLVANHEAAAAVSCMCLSFGGVQCSVDRRQCWSTSQCRDFAPAVCTQPCSLCSGENADCGTWEETLLVGVPHMMMLPPQVLIFFSSGIIDANLSQLVLIQWYVWSPPPPFLNVSRRNCWIPFCLEHIILDLEIRNSSLLFSLLRFYYAGMKWNTTKAQSPQLSDASSFPNDWLVWLADDCLIAARTFRLKPHLTWRPPRYI